jgi:hypothetical protein
MRSGGLARVVATYAAALAGGTALWVLLFHSPLLADWVFFYRGLALLLVATIVVVGPLVALRRAGKLALMDVRDVLLIGSLLLSVNVLFFTHLPVTADRSISVFMLAYLNAAAGPRTADQIEQAVVQEYIQERGAIGKRLEEQLVTGTLIQTSDGYALSDEGRSLIGYYRAIARLFDMNPANLEP